MKERQINILDLIWDILLRWRMLVLSIMLGGILMAVFSYGSSQLEVVKEVDEESGQKEEVSQEDNKKELEESLSDKEISNVLAAIKYEQLYESFCEQQEEVFALNVDPFSVVKADIILNFQAADKEQTYNVQQMYARVLQSAELYKYVEEQCLLDYNADQLVSIDAQSYSIGKGSDSIRVRVIYSDEKKCQEIISSIVAYVEMKQMEWNEILGEHNVNAIIQSSMIVADESYLSRQAENERNMVVYRDTIANLKGAFSDQQKKYYACLSGIEAEQEVDEEVKTVSVKASVDLKYVVFGMILMVVIYVMFAVARYVLNNKLRASENLADIYNISHLGMISAESDKKKILGVIDNCILSIKNRNKRKFTREEALIMASVAVKMATKKAGYEEVHIVGCDIKKQTAEVCEKMKNILCKDGIKVTILDNILYDVESLEKLGSAKCVVIVEKAASTLYVEVAKEIELLDRQDITVLGGIVVE